MKRKKRKKLKLSNMEKFARALSQRLTRHEVIFMRRLTLSGKIQFDFQVRIGPYFADFVFPDRMLIIEIDGSNHRVQKKYDAERDRFMESFGFTIWRIENKHVQEWPLSQLLNHRLNSQPALTYNQAIQASASSGFRPSEVRRPGAVRRFQEVDTTAPDFYPQLIKRVSETVVAL
jgi:very-short-patch-repair endonuclease